MSVRETSGTLSCVSLFQQSPMPNPPVKGTCLRQAPYVER